MQRRKFFRSLALGGVSAAISPIIKAAPFIPTDEKIKPGTNIHVAMSVPRTTESMPGKFPGKVVKIDHPAAIANGQPSESAAYEMIETSLLLLTRKNTLKEAWFSFVSPEDVIGLKVNPIGGKLLSTSHAVTKSVIKQLREAGIPDSNIIIWDRREADLKESGFTEENYPGITIMGTEFQDKDGSYVAPDGTFYGEQRIDKSNYFYADIEGEYDAYTMPYMINGGKNSYFSTICTDKVTKIINIPVVKNAGSSITVCMKNLAFGSITNTGRLHSQLWHETSAYVCAFPPIRDKVVLNIADGIKGCFDGGPAANPQFICQYNTLIIGSDPVAVDRICYEMVLNKRIEEGLQTEEKPGSRDFMNLAENLKLGIADIDNIELAEITLEE